jgi:hypothetical protein
MDSAAVTSLVISGPGASDEDSVTVERDGAEAFQVREGGVPGVQVRQALRCGVLGSLESSLRRCGEGEALADLVQTVLGDRLVRPVALQTGDELRLVVDKVMDGDFLIQYRRVTALEVRRAGTAEITAVWFDGNYYAPSGTSVEPLFLHQPLQTGHQTSSFGMRLHPILHRMKAH